MSQEINAEINAEINTEFSSPSSSAALSSSRPSTVEEMLSSASMSMQPHIEWSSEHEAILVEWADKAMCYRWLHSKSNVKYSSMNTWFTIPVIIMSTLTGTANFAQNQIDIAYRNYATMAIGAVNLLAGILTTIQQFLKIGELNESHRASSISWGKFYRNIKVELTKAPAERVPVIQMLKISKEEFDRLMETSPALSEKIIQNFKATFSGGEIKLDKNGKSIGLTDKQTAYIDLIKPEICDSLETTATSVYKSKPVIKLAKQATMLPVVSAKEKEFQIKKEKVKKFIENFEKEMKRAPTIDEIMSNLDGPLLTNEMIENILNEMPSLININNNNYNNNIEIDEFEA
jgi:hypothetical protein